MSSIWRGAGYAGLVRACNTVTGRRGSFSLINATGAPAWLLAMIGPAPRHEIDGEGDMTTGPDVTSWESS